MVRKYLVSTNVLEQTYWPIEIIIVDKGSSDDSGQVTDALAHDHPGEIAVMHQANAD
jgi:glycosyltransferase involved in cell wall biosynthesis